MKKIYLFILVALFCLLALAACGGKEESNEKASGSDSKTGSGDQIELDFWHFDTGTRKEIYEAAVKRFEEKNPNVKVNIVQAPNDDYKQRVVVAMASGEAPDVFASWGGGWLEEFVKSDKVLNLTEKEIDFERFVDVALNNSKFDDKIYGLPLGISVYSFYYNKEIFEQNGLEVPETYSELLAAIDKLKKADVYPIALANQPKWPGAFFLMYLADRIGGEEVFQQAYRRTGTGFDDDAYIQAGKYIQELVEMEAFNPGFNGIPYDSGQARQLMYSGQAAMLLQTSAFVNHVREEYPEFEEKMGVFQFPAVEGGKGDPSNMSAGISPTWSVKKDTKHPELAVALLNELTSLETAQDYVNRSGNVVAIKGVEVEDGYVKTFTEWINEANSIQFPYDQTLPPELAELHKDTTYELFGLSKTPEEAAKAMENKAKEILK
ncbi:extracellular solute-binding protein [Bacillus timonensis]|uniref:Extracellular solute-binding protein n=1 Tax=Bacillus timonensis TaxID=1033734 RepID=A0A4S3PPV3_9BACI|nr:extracellular solute-binding protein [Bacillus timonensis]THE11334.1 extracellular solute-binding protein [Bacillus timonensis]